MKTLYLSAADADTAAVAAQIIRNGGLVALPTETVYGLGANGLDPAAVAKIFTAKGRPQDNPLILHICDPSQMGELCHSIPQSAWALAAAFWPGPLTMVLPAKDCVPLSTRGGLPTVGVRCPDSDITRAIIRQSGVPIAAPSANISGKPSTTTARHVLHDHDGRIDCVVDGGACRVGVESTIVDLTEHPPRLLRPGGITRSELESVVGEVTVDDAITRTLSENEVAKAPGMKYQHYAPQCTVVIVSGDSQTAAAWVRQHWKAGDRVLCFDEELPLYRDCAPLSYGREADPATLSAGLFDALRQLDDPSVGTVYARCPEDGGIGMAVRNRLSKAAAFRIIHPPAPPMEVCHCESVRTPGRTLSLRGGNAAVAIPTDDRLPSIELCHCEAAAPPWQSPPTPTAPSAETSSTPNHSEFVLGITGGTGCGKTTLLNTIRSLGGTVIDCDAVYHRLLKEDRALVAAIDEQFPGTVFRGVLDRKKLGALVFSDPVALGMLNRIAHPAIYRAVKEQLTHCDGLVAIDAIALFECQLNKLCRTTVAVTAPTEDRVNRLMDRDNISEAYARLRIAAQPDNYQFSRLCRYTLENTGTMEEFEAKCLAFLKTLGIMKP